MSTSGDVGARTETLPADECWRRLHAADVGRLGVIVGRQPDIFPVNYFIDDGTIVIRTGEGTKLAAALMGRRVAFEIDEFDTADHAGWSVVVHGRATESRTLPAVMHDRNLNLHPWADGEMHRYIHIQPDRISGRRLPDTPAVDDSLADGST